MRGTSWLGVVVWLGVVAFAQRATAAAPQPLAGFVVTEVATGLSQPTGFAFLPDGRLVILEKAGHVRLWTPTTGLRHAPLLEIPTCTDAEMGLLGVAVDPDFATTGFLYLYHTQPPAGDAGRCGTADGRTNRIVRVTMQGDAIDPMSLLVLLDGIRTDNGNHDGGCLRFGPDGYLYASTGDSGRGDGNVPPGQATNPYAQDPTSLNGKILRMTRAGTPVTDPSDPNPFVGQGGDADWVFARGLRNAFRFAFEPATGLLWAGEVGQITWEEVDVVPKGGNLGWPLCEGFEPAGCPADTVKPIFAYPHDGRHASVTGGVFDDADRLGADLRGSYFFGDFVDDLIWRAVPTHAPAGFAGAPTVFVAHAGAPVDFAFGPDGGLYWVAFGKNAVRRLVAMDAVPTRCLDAIVDALPRWTRAAARATASCLRSGGGVGCMAESPGTPRGVVRRLARACGAPPPAALCARLGCAACASAEDLSACAAGAAAGLSSTLGSAVLADGTSRCERAVVRGLGRVAIARLVDRMRCRRQGLLACAPTDVSPRLAAGIARACPAPSAGMCSTLACDPCPASGLGACLTAAEADVVDGLWDGRLVGAP